jgi:hypothetical protein
LRKSAADLPKIAARLWESKKGSSEREVKRLMSEREELKKRKTRLLTMRIEEEISREEFEEDNAGILDKERDIDAKIEVLSLVRATADAFVQFAELQVMDIAHLWQIANPEQQVRVQNLLFEGGLKYSPESGFLNHSTSSIFNALETVDFEETNLVDLIGIEPMTSSMPWNAANRK